MIKPEWLQNIEELQSSVPAGEWNSTVYDAGGSSPYCGYPLIAAPNPDPNDADDVTLVHWAGFKQEHWGELNEKQANKFANYVTETHNISVPTLLSALNKAYELIEDAPHSSTCNVSWSSLNNQCNCWKHEALEAINNLQEGK